ncbi:MAG TPA: PhnD/SsuA/transferrin family substrate-binding protein [Acidimicrobiales bacterium]|jgi:ABC-type phosphate/phosphonate transport system substrate-binding protein|nr:PhnD/SsuA/transferrin family substrate-binding protein [Acidimicrobiales bacterium]
MAGDLLMGAVAYDPKVVTIWEGFRRWLVERGLKFDYVFYSNYERQAEELVAGRIDAAWNSPLAWIRCCRLAQANDLKARALVMRDTDRDLSSVVVVRSDSKVASVADLSGKIVAVGAVDSPQANLLPVDLLRRHGLRAGENLEIRLFDIGAGLHGDHIGGERAAARALLAGEVDAACMIDTNHLGFSHDGSLPAGSSRIVAQTGSFDHCNMTVIDASASGPVETFARLLLSMDFADPEVRPLLDLEGLTQWVPGRTEGYVALEHAVDAVGFYDKKGAVIANDYRP